MGNSSDRPVMFRRACIIVLTLIASHYCIARDLSSASLRITAFDESNAAVTKAQTQLPRDQVKEIPGRPVTIIDALPLVPGVVRAPNGTVLIYGSNEHHSGFVVNSANVTDPVTGQFQPTVPIDSVDTVTVYKTPYLAQYGGFTSGIVSVDTRRGGDKWHYELNDPFPEFRVRSAHIVG